MEYKIKLKNILKKIYDFYKMLVMMQLLIKEMYFIKIIILRLMINQNKNYLNYFILNIYFIIFYY